jgi:SHS family lactate transporter-like MFS transporter
VDRHPAGARDPLRKYVNEPPVWPENRRLQREVRAPLMAIFKRDPLGNTLTACGWMASSFVVGYSIGTLFATHLQKDLGLSAALVALPVMLQNLLIFISCCCWDRVAGVLGSRWAMILPALLAIPVTPLYLLTNNHTRIVVFFALAGMLRRRRHLWPECELHDRARPARGVRDG